MKYGTALIIIDMINTMDFEGSEALYKNTKPIIDPLLNLKKSLKKRDIPTIYVNDNYELWHDNLEDIIHLCQKGKAKDIVDQFIPSKDDFFIIKPKHSGFFGTQLDILLKHLNIKNLILTGVAGDICVLFTAADAYMRDYNLWVPRDCIASETDQDNEAALRLMKRSTSALIRRTIDVEMEDVFHVPK